MIKGEEPMGGEEKEQGCTSAIQTCAPVRSCKHSSTKSSACSVSHIQCGTDNVTLRFRLHFTCQLCAHHNSTVNAVDWPLLRRMTSGARSVTEAVRLLCASFKGHYGGWVFLQKKCSQIPAPIFTISNLSLQPVHMKQLFLRVHSSHVSTNKVTTCF